MDETLNRHWSLPCGACAQGCKCVYYGAFHNSKMNHHVWALTSNHAYWSKCYYDLLVFLISYLYIHVITGTVYVFISGAFAQLKLKCRQYPAIHTDSHQLQLFKLHHFKLEIFKSI